MYEDSKFKLDCVESRNSHTWLIDIIKFKLRFINFVYFFEKVVLPWEFWMVSKFSVLQDKEQILERFRGK